MSSPDDLEVRVTRLEQEVVRLRERVAETSGDLVAARVLASGADRDVSEVRAELRAHTQALNALRETQREMGEAQREMRDDIAGMRAGFADLRLGMAQIVTLLGGSPPSS